MLTGSFKERRSDATNSYDLMTDIAAYILEEPKRVYMGDWLMEGDEIRRRLGDEGPVCGTVGCIAGNAGVLTDGRASWTVCEDVLSGGDRQLRRALLNLFYDTEVKASYGTEEYARIVAKRIENFQVRYEADLRAVTF